jgi:hypothetical protein
MPPASGGLAGALLESRGQSAKPTGRATASRTPGRPPQTQPRTILTVSPLVGSLLARFQIFEDASTRLLGVIRGCSTAMQTRDLMSSPSPNKSPDCRSPPDQISRVDLPVPTEVARGHAMQEFRSVRQPRPPPAPGAPSPPRRAGWLRQLQRTRLTTLTTPITASMAGTTGALECIVLFAANLLRASGPRQRFGIG